MAAHLIDRRGRKVELNSDLVLRLLNDGDDSEIEGLDDEELDLTFEPRAVRTLSPIIQPIEQVNQSEPLNRSEQVNQSEQVTVTKYSGPTKPEVRQKRTASRKIITSQVPSTPQETAINQSATSTSRSSNIHRAVPQRRLWKNIPFNQIEHNYPEPIPVLLIKTALEYFQDYFPDVFFEEMAYCTNTYHLRSRGSVLNTNAIEIKKLMGIHFVMGCIPYPRLHMYWRQEMQLKLIADKMPRDRFKTLRSSLHVVRHEAAPDNTNALWKVQPVIDQVNNACYNYERTPGYYSIDEQMIPFCGVCPRGLRQVIKSKPRPQGLKAFIAATSDGLMIDFKVYQGVRTMFEDKSLGIGAAVILDLTKTIPPGSCVYFERYFTSVPLLERLNEIGLHGTGTVMANRIPDRGTFKFKDDRKMKRGESEQFVSGKVVVVKWMDNKPVLVSSNCTSADNQVQVKRWEKKENAFIDVNQPLAIANYNKHMGGVDVLDQSIGYYRTFMKTKKWTLKVILHFFDLAVANAWRKYKMDSSSARIHRGQVMDLLEFKLQVAEGLMNSPNRPRPMQADDEENIENRDVNCPSGRYRPANPPSEPKRYDGYEHFPEFDEIASPRRCRMEGCESRSKIRCDKCDVYLCLSRKSNCFASYHKK